MIKRFGPPSHDYKLVWAGEFDGKVLNKDKWSYRLLGPRGGATLVADCVSLDGKGHLVITTRRNGNKIETGMIGTEGKFEAKFGYFEARIKFQTEPGHWSAFWLQSPTMSNVGDPKNNGVEIDIVEYFKTDKDAMFSNIHRDGYGQEHKKIGSRHTNTALAKGWHVVGMECTADGYHFFLDGEQVWHTATAVSHVNEYIILSLEVGEWAGDIAKAMLPDSVMFDYVRVYSK